MSGTKITQDQLPLAKTGGKRAHLKREDHPVRWPSSASGNGAAYVSYEQVPEGGAAPEACSEN